MSEWKDLVGKINSAKLGDKYIEDCLKGLVYRYYNDGDKACDSRNDPYGYATKYFNALNDSLNDSEIDDIMYKPRIKYETKLKILIDYVCDAYGKNSTKESKKSTIKSIKEGRVDKGAVVYEFCCMLNRLGYLSYDYSNESNDEKCDEIVYMIMDLLKTMPKA